MNAPRGNNGMAVASIVCGIGSWVGLPFLAAIAGVVCGHMALKQIQTSGEQGEGMAKAGLALSYINIALSVLTIIFVVVLILVFGMGVFAVGAANQ